MHERDNGVQIHPQFAFLNHVRHYFTCMHVGLCIAHRCGGWRNSNAIAYDWHVCHHYQQQQIESNVTHLSTLPVPFTAGSMRSFSGLAESKMTLLAVWKTKSAPFTTSSKLPGSKRSASVKVSLPGRALRKARSGAVFLRSSTLVTVPRSGPLAHRQGLRAVQELEIAAESRWEDVDNSM